MVPERRCCAPHYWKKSQADGTLTDNDADVRLTAISRITDPARLQRIVLTSMGPYVLAYGLPWIVRTFTDLWDMREASSTKFLPHAAFGISFDTKTCD